MEQNERSYRSVVTRIGASLLVFLGLLSLSQWIYSFLEAPLVAAFGEKMGYVINELLYGVAYFLSFTLPILFFSLISRGKDFARIRLSFRITAETPLILVASIGVIYLSAIVNSILSQPLISPSFDYEALFVTYDYSEPYKVILAYIVLAIVPGICEELLFRGLILTNLLPFGKTGAVLASAFLFGLMHQNPLQIFYTTMAGILLGLIYLYTDSFFICVLVHVSNNAYSVFLEWISESFGEAGPHLVAMIEWGFLLLSLVAIFFLFLRARQVYSARKLDGDAEKSYTNEDDLSLPIAPVRKLRLFFSPTVIIFIVLTVLEMGFIALLMMGGLS